MKKLVIILFYFPLLIFSQQTYVPDDVFEDYIETNIPMADNGIPNDNYVLTSGLDLTNNNMFSLGMQLNPAFLSSNIIADFTGIEDFVALSGGTISQLEMTNIDLSMAKFQNHPLNPLNQTGVSIQFCSNVVNIYLPSDSFNLSIASDSSLQNIFFQDSTYIGVEGGSCDFYIAGCPELLSVDISHILGLGVNNGGALMIQNNDKLSYLNIQNGYCSNWTDVDFTYNPLLTCIQVDNPSYSQNSFQWHWQENVFNSAVYNYSVNCGSPSVVHEEKFNKEILKITDLLGRESKGLKTQPLIYIYDDGTVEKKIIVE